MTENDQATTSHCSDGSCGICPTCEDHAQHVCNAHSRARAIAETLTQAQTSIGEALRELKQLPRDGGDDAELAADDFGDLRSALHGAARQLRNAARITTPYVDQLAAMEPARIGWGLRRDGEEITGPYPSRVAAQHAQIHQGGRLVYRIGGSDWRPWPSRGLPPLLLVADKRAAHRGRDHHV